MTEVTPHLLSDTSRDRDGPRFVDKGGKFPWTTVTWTGVSQTLWKVDTIGSHISMMIRHEVKDPKLNGDSR